jgi:hypothetical protein
MSARAETKVFGVRIGVDPKILTGVLVAIAGILIWFNTRSDDDAPAATTVTRRGITAEPATAPVRAATRSRRGQTANDRGTLHLRAIDPTRGDVDPTLRLDLLARLQNVELGTGGRSLFEAGPPPLTPAEKKLLDHPPVVKPPPTPPPAPPPVPTEPVVNIPLKYYGFVKSGANSQSNAGLFLDGDNIIVGSEGEIVMKRYLIVALTGTSARMEDTQLKKGQTLPVVPAATP